jgi:hypothetical protein
VASVTTPDSAAITPFARRLSLRGLPNDAGVSWGVCTMPQQRSSSAFAPQALPRARSGRDRSAPGRRSGRPSEVWPSGSPCGRRVAHAVHVCNRVMSTREHDGPRSNTSGRHIHVAFRVRRCDVRLPTHDRPGADNARPSPLLVLRAPCTRRSRGKTTDGATAFRFARNRAIQLARSVRHSASSISLAGALLHVASLEPARTPPRKESAARSTPTQAHPLLHPCKGSSDGLIAPIHGGCCTNRG